MGLRSVAWHCFLNHATFHTSVQKIHAVCRDVRSSYFKKNCETALTMRRPQRQKVVMYNLSVVNPVGQGSRTLTHAHVKYLIIDKCTTRRWRMFTQNTEELIIRWGWPATFNPNYHFTTKLKTSLPFRVHEFPVVKRFVYLTEGIIYFHFLILQFLSILFSLCLSLSFPK